MDDAALVSRSLAEPELFVGIFERHHGAVHRYLQRRVGLDAADDLAAEVFVQAFRVRGRFRPGPDGGALPWLYGIAGNLLRGERRREQRHLHAVGRIVPGGGDTAWTDDAAARTDAAAEGPALTRALGRLRPAEREVLLLHALGDLSYAELAVALAVPVGTVRSRLSRARAKVRRALDVTSDPGAATCRPRDARA